MLRPKTHGTHSHPPPGTNTSSVRVCPSAVHHIKRHRNRPQQLPREKLNCLVLRVRRHHHRRHLHHGAAGQHFAGLFHYPHSDHNPGGRAERWVLAPCRAAEQHAGPGASSTWFDLDRNLKKKRSRKPQGRLTHTWLDSPSWCSRRCLRSGSSQLLSRVRKGPAAMAH